MTSRNVKAAQQTREKLSVDRPTGFLDIIEAVVLYFSRLVLFWNIYRKLVFTIVLIIFFSLFGHFYQLPHFYFSSKTNVFNFVFIKWGWAWTLFLLIPFVSLTSYIIENRSVLHTAKHSSRMVIATFVWLYCTRFFVHLEQKTGLCTKPILKKQNECVAAGGKWSSFDISGHVFIMLYSLLVIAEESVVFHSWRQLHHLLNYKTNSKSATGRPAELKAISEEDVIEMAKLYAHLTPYIKGFLFSMAVLSVIWYKQLIITALYYHQVEHKVIACFFAVSLWFLTYRVWFQHFPPSLPGHGKITYQNDRLW